METPDTDPENRLTGWAQLWIVTCLASWLGAAVYFTLAVAPAVFSLAREPGAAGMAIADLLGGLHIGGACLFLSAAGAARASRHRASLRLGLLGLALLCLLSHFGVSRPLAELRQQHSEGRTAAEAERFRRLHLLSVGIFGVIGMGATALLIAHRMPEAPRRDVATEAS